ncbi:MAG: T9SS type A sorting domain-containing protein [Fibrobacteres bacterium]|nr:T9SS type A sorting domain-containing protein [Fibrobacterota bacterium]
MILVRDSLYTIDIRLQARFECAGKPTAPYLASSDTNMIAIKFLISDLMGPIPANSADDSVTLFVDIDTKERISAEQFPDDIDYEFTLGQNSPNPFNPTTEIKFSIPENGVAKMELFTLDGRRVKILQNGWLKKGRYNIALRTDDLMSGTYLYRLSTGKQVSSKVMSIIK